MASTRQSVLKAYKMVMRAQREAFKDDLRMQHAAKSQIRAEFNKHIAERDINIIESQLKYAEEIVNVLKANVVQGQWVTKDRLRLNLDPSRHELGDNESIKHVKK